MKLVTDSEFENSFEEDKVKNAYLIAKILKYLSKAILVWTFMFPRPYEYILIACLIMPIIGIIAVRLGRGLIKIELNQDNDVPNVIFTFLPVIIFSCYLQFNFSIDDYSNVWILVTIVTIVFSVFFLAINRKFLEIENWYITIIRVVLFSFVYAYVAVIGINCVFDKSHPEVFTSRVYDKKNKGILSKTYEVEVASWKKDTETEKILINENEYNKLQKGDKASIYMFRGVFNIPWVEVD